MERETGIEPATSILGSWRSTAELLPLSVLIMSGLPDSCQSLRSRKVPLKWGLPVTEWSYWAAFPSTAFLLLTFHQQERGQRVTEIVKAETSAIRLDNLQFHRSRTNVVSNHPRCCTRLFTVQLDRRQHLAFIAAIHAFLPPTLKNLPPALRASEPGAFGCLRLRFSDHFAYYEAGEYQPDIILLDIGLPKLNGIEAARRIRQVRCRL